MCTRITYKTADSKIYNGRNLDWYESPKPSIWALSAGLKRCGAATGKSVTWTSKYASIVTSNYEYSQSCNQSQKNVGATGDGINEKGLVANLLWLADSHYPVDGQPYTQDKQPLSLAAWTQYILDLCQNVEEAIQMMAKVYIQTSYVPDSKIKALCHLAVGDAQGKIAIFEYIKGELHISSNLALKNKPKHYCQYNDEQMLVMTNEPYFSEQLAMDKYWALSNRERVKSGCPIHLPGTSSSTDRFVRASYYTKQLKTENVDTEDALSGVASVMHNVARPIGEAADSTTEKPNEAQTFYTTMADQSTLFYFYQSVFSPFIIWINFNQLKFPVHAAAEGIGLNIKLNEMGVLKSSNNTFTSGDVTNMAVAKPVYDFIHSDITTR